MRKPASEWYRYSLMISILLMISCLFISRAFLSVSMIVFFVLTICRKTIGSQIRTVLRNPLYVSVTLLFLIPLISGLWSHDHAKWLDVVRIKLPLLLFPFAFAFNWPLIEKDWKYIALFFSAALFIAVTWSFVYYQLHANYFNEAYLRAKLIDTPLDNDHVRFSWLVVTGVIVNSILWIESRRRFWKLIGLLVTLCLVLYLHLLAARTGLVCLYIVALGSVIYLLRVSANKKWIITLAVILIIASITSWFAFPTLQNRFRYFRYDFSTVADNQYIPGSNDGARVLSLKAGWHVLQLHPLGVGAGDVMHETDKWYSASKLNVLESDKFYPCSEWITYGMFAGWSGVLLFTLIMVVPFFIKVPRYAFIWVILNGIAAFSFIFDIGLEAQYGAFIYPFIILCFYKWMTNKRIQ